MAGITGILPECSVANNATIKDSCFQNKVPSDCTAGRVNGRSKALHHAADAPVSVYSQAGQQELLQGERLSTTVKVRESDSWCFPFDHLTTYQPFPCSQETYQKVSNDTVPAVHKGMLPYKVVNNAILPLKIKNRHQTCVTRRVYRTAFSGRSGSCKRASRSTIGIVDRSEPPKPPA